MNTPATHARDHIAMAPQANLDASDRSQRLPGFCRVRTALRATVLRAESESVSVLLLPHVHSRWDTFRTPVWCRSGRNYLSTSHNIRTDNHSRDVDGSHL